MGARINKKWGARGYLIGIISFFQKKSFYPLIYRLKLILGIEVPIFEVKFPKEKYL